ncbi:MAG TPA: FAD-binding oxidoreductase [Candidatus Peribacterales bacterium]|nr:FAD-binding oxidoreductase [Candidatus Peribacterales bacterium]
MPTPSYLTTCTKNIPLSKSGSTFEVRLKIPDGERFQFEAGQFTLFDVPSIGNPADIQPRAYSIASPPSESTELTFVIMNKEGGRATQWVKEVLKVGDTVRMQGPFGVFTLYRENNPKDFVFVATGTGLAPFTSMIPHALENGEKRPMYLFFCVRHEEDLFCMDTLRMLEKKYPNFHAHVSISQPTASWNGLRGRVQEIIPSVIKDFSRIQVYACGSPDMVKGMKDWLAERGVEKADMHAEGYV